MAPNTTSSHPSTDHVASHTPGPWRVERRVGDALQVNAEHRGKGSSYCVASVNHWEGPADRANAYLIAAAPDLLTALKAMDESLCNGFDTQAARHAGRMALIAARAAIAKAEGRS